MSSGSVAEAPPPVLGSARVLEYAVLDDKVPYSGHSGLLVDGKELGPVPRLAVCQRLGSAEVDLLHCDKHWDLLGVQTYPDVTAARARAERTYPGITRLWVDAGVTEAAALASLQELFAGQTCSFCGKRPDEVNRIIEQNGARICDGCVVDLHRELHSEDGHFA